MWSKYEGNAQISVFPTILSVVNFVRGMRENNAVHVNALFTGSLHLVGGSLKIINGLANERQKRQSVST
jgi:hypothetical protein